MRKALGGSENVVFLSAALLLLFSALAAAVVQSHVHLQNGRVQFGMEHLPGALGAAFLFTAATGLARAVLVRRPNLAECPTVFYLLFIVAVFSVFWLPALLAGGFDEDDWMLLAAASIRKVIYLHPSYSWHALDAVDGNFRPLGTVLYFGYLYRWFGLWAGPYLAGLFAVNLLGCLVAFFIVRTLGYSRMAAAAACLLYLSRSLTYPIQTWPAALGDALAILLCGCMALAILKAMARQGWVAAGLHLVAWGNFCLATLAKQSAFAAPLIVALLLFLQPGQRKAGLFRHRARAALLGLAIYGGTAALVFFHGKALLQAPQPYPVKFSFEALWRTFAYPVWYFGTFEFPQRIILLRWLPSMVGAGIVAGAVVLLRRTPRALGERPCDVLFCLLAATASLSLFVVLPVRVAPYYAGMSAFWVSIALGISLTRFGTVLEGGRAARVCCFIVCALLVTGFVDVRLKQTGLLPSGGYPWATFTSSFHRRMYEGLAASLTASLRTEILVLADMPGNQSYYTAMALLASPRLQRILVYDSSAKTYFVNDLAGARPNDGYDALNDPKAYNWTIRMETAEAERLAGKKPTLWLRFHEGKIAAGY